ncbi:MAG: hypothetical protein ABR568_22455, partial [Pyrinomonadaceae bacterium]
TEPFAVANGFPLKRAETYCTAWVATVLCVAWLRLVLSDGIHWLPQMVLCLEHEAARNGRLNSGYFL